MRLGCDVRALTLLHWQVPDADITRVNALLAREEEVLEMESDDPDGDAHPKQNAWRSLRKRTKAWTKQSEALKRKNDKENKPKDAVAVGLLLHRDLQALGHTMHVIADSYRHVVSLARSLRLTCALTPMCMQNNLDPIGPEEGAVEADRIEWTEEELSSESEPEEEEEE